jgi:Cof subfamily protein (haloacid dehalogenase superfamily)
VTSEKRLTTRACEAVAALGRYGILFSLISSRPPFGLAMLVEPLGLRLPLASFNGGMLINPDLSPITRTLLGEATARRAVEFLEEAGVGAWLFTRDAWIARDADGAYVARERQTVLVEPRIVTSFAPFLGEAGKIVGVSADFARLAALEPKLKSELGDRATVARSQAYYLDVTPPGIDKGTTVAVLAARLAIPLERVVTLGDMENDVPMFRKAGFSIAMGNASAEVKAAAKAVTLTNDEDGFAAAIEGLILPA